MTVAYDQFREELYIEHLEEAAFLYETRINWLDDEEIGWQDLADVDSRLEAHIDALIVGGKMAFQLCLDSLEEADFSTLHVVVRLFCRYQSIEFLSQLWSSLDYEDKEKTKAVADALRWDCPASWLPHLVKVFASDKAEMFSILAPSVVAGARAEGHKLASALSNTKDDDLEQILKNIAFSDRTQASDIVTKVAPYINHAEVKVAGQAVLASLMMGDSRGLAQCVGRIGKMPHVFAIAGNLADSRRLIEFSTKGTADADTLIAIGLAGNLEAVTSLLGYLKHPDYALQAAWALYLITGAPLFEDVHVEDEVEEDELFEHEIEPFKKGELPKNIDGDPFGSEVRQLSIDPEVWRKWLEQNRNKFSQGARYRLGEAFSPMVLIKSLIDNQTPNYIRALTYQELVVRYALALPFIADDLVLKQQIQLNEIYRWGQQMATQWQAGRWYFNGQLKEG